MAKAVALLSGGLDSQLAVRLMLAQGVGVQCLTSVSIFHASTVPGAAAPPDTRHPAVAAAERLGIPIILTDTNQAMLDLVRHPKHGHGKNLNPCVDCRIMLLRRAHERMRQTGADFIVTGEVLGQRPMSQRRWSLDLIEREAGVVGLVLRPLSAKLLPPSRPELDGLVDREKLLAIRGRSRLEQMALAAGLGLTDYPTPAGGCLLTDPNFSFRLAELLRHGEPQLDDVELLRVGRHFRLDQRTKAVVGRLEPENYVLERLARPGDLLLDAADFTGPTVLLRGDTSDQNIKAAAALTIKYGKARTQPSARVVVRMAGTPESFALTVTPASDADAARLIIAR